MVTAPPKAGGSYYALANLSVPRAGDPEHKTDLVMAGETILLTDEQAEPFLHRRVGHGQGPAVIAPAKSGGVPPRLLPRNLSGQVQSPPAKPPPGYTGPRADPPGSSHVQVIEPRDPGPGDIPELTDPHTEDAVDIPPGGIRR